MAKTKISQFDANAANNTDLNSISIAEGTAPSNINNAIRELMSQLADLNLGNEVLSTLKIDNLHLDGNTIVTLDTNGDLNLTPNGTGSVVVAKVDINGGAIDGTPIGGSSASTGAFTTLSASSTANLGSSVTVSGGNIDGVIGANTPAAITGTVITANTNFAGNLTGNVTGTVDGVVGGTTPAAITGTTITANTKFVGAIDGNVTATSGTSTFNNVTINGTLDMDSTTSQTITGLATPSGSTDAATKGYVDTEVSALVDSAPSTLNTLNELAAALGDDASFSTTVTNSIAAKLPLAGGTMTGDIDANSNTVSGLKAPSASNDATTKTYVDTADALKLNLSGGTLSGNLAMGSNKVTGLDTPTASGDATTKGYVDGILGSATAAATSASAAATSATSAATSATASASSATAAASSATSAAASYDSFDDRYLGAKSSAPTVDNDGDALVTGALYFNTSSNQLFIWSGSAWTQAAFTASGFLSGSNNLSDVDNAGTARTNLGLAIGTNVQAFDADLSALAGLTSAADKGIQFTGSGTAATYDLTSAGKALLDDADAAAQRTTLGLGSAATQAVGTSANNVVQLDGSAKLPAVDGSQLTNIASAEATLTKTFLTNEQSTISLSDNVVAPVVSVTKEVAQSGQTNNAWDINSTTENYTRLNSATATTLSFTNPNLSTASYSQNFSVVSQDTFPNGIAFNTDGTKMFIVGITSDNVSEYDLTTGFDVSTASHTRDFDVSGQDTSPQEIAFNTDGTKMFIVGGSGTDVNEYALSTGFDVSTASYTQNFSVSSQETGPAGIAFNTDGTKMFIVGYTGDEVNEYALTTGFDVSTASYTQNFDVSSQDSVPTGIAFNSDGTKMFVCGTAGDAVYEYALSTGFDISTASFSESFSVASQESNPRSITFNTDGTKMFIVGAAGQDVNEYTLTFSAVSLGSGSFASADVGKTIEANSGKFILTATSGSITQTTAPTSYAQVASGSWEMYAVAYNTTDGDLELSGIDQTFDLSKASYTQNFSVSSQETTPDGIAFNTDGTKMFISGDSGNDINTYDLSTGFDVSTASVNSSQNYSVSSNTTSVTGMSFNNDGTKMYVCSYSPSSIFQYNLSTAFQANTASYAAELSVSSQDSNPRQVQFNTDGTKMFMLGYTGKDITEFTLSTGFNISTAGSPTTFSVNSQDTDPFGLAFNNDGTKMFVSGAQNDKIYEYTLSTAFSTATATFSQDFDISSQDTSPKGIAFNTDGTKLFLVGNTGDDVNEYALGSFLKPSGYHAVHTTNSTDSTYWTDINSMTADEAAGDGTVHYCVSTDDRAIWKIAHNSNGIRSIVRNNSGTWQYNSNGTYGSETWTNGATNTEIATLQEAMGTSVNRMNKTQLDAVADANHFTLGNDLDLGIIFNLSSGTTVPSSDGVSINYDANVLNKGAILGTDYDFDAPAQNKVRITALAANNLKIRVV